MTTPFGSMWRIMSYSELTLPDRFFPAEAVRRQADELGLELTAHAVSYDLNPLSQNPEIREVSRKQVMQSFIEAAAMGAKVVTVHPGQLSSGTDDPEDYWPDLLDFCSTLNDKTKGLELNVGIEGMERKVNQFFVEPTALNRLAEAMGNEGWSCLGLTVDMAHLATFADPWRLSKRSSGYRMCTSPMANHPRLRTGPSA